MPTLKVHDKSNALSAGGGSACFGIVHEIVKIRLQAAE
jgi:hypothetical protein